MKKVKCKCGKTILFSNGSTKKRILKKDAICFDCDIKKFSKVLEENLAKNSNVLTNSDICDNI